MLVSSKRAQTEDFFADFLPAMVVLIIALVVGSFLSVSHSGRITEEVGVASVAFNGVDAFSFLRTPLHISGYADVASLLIGISEAYEAKDKAFFDGTVARLGSEYAECSRGFEDAVGPFFAGKKWYVSVFEVESAGILPQKKVFECNRLGVQDVSAFASAGNGIRFSEAYLPSSGFTAYRVLMGWKNE